MNELFQKAALEMGLNVTELRSVWGQDILKISKGEAAIHVLDGNRLGNTSLLAAELGGNRLSVKLAFKALGIPQPAFHHFYIEDPMELNVHFLEAENAAFVKEEQHYTLRPAQSNDRHGCRYNLFDHQEMFHHLRDFSETYATWVLEEELDGRRFQVLALKGEIISAISKQAFGLVGDGESSLEELIHAFNRELPANVEMLAVNAEMRYLLREQDIFLSDIPSKGQFVRLQEAGDASSVANASELLKPEHREWVTKITNALGLTFFSLEIVVNEAGTSFALDLDPAPEWPDFDLSGKNGREIGKEILSKLL